MPRKTPNQPGSSRSKPPASDADTSSYTQPHAPASDLAPNKRNERMPHERDESASATGDRLQENPRPSDRQISQAHDDVEDGLVDTDRRGTASDLPKRKTT